MLSPPPTGAKTLPPTGNTSKATGFTDNGSSLETISMPLEKSQNPKKGQSAQDSDNAQNGNKDKALTIAVRVSRKMKDLSDVSQLCATSPGSTNNQGPFTGQPSNSKHEQKSNQPFDFSCIPDGSYPSENSPNRRHTYRNSYAGSGDLDNEYNQGSNHVRVQSFPPSNILVSSPSHSNAAEDSFLQRIFRNQGSFSLESSPARQPRNLVSYDINSQMLPTPPLPLHSPISIGHSSAPTNPRLSVTSSTIEKDMTDNHTGSITPMIIPPSPQNSCNSHTGSFQSNNNNIPLVQTNLYISSTPSDVSNTSSRSIPSHTQNQANTHYPSNKSQTSEMNHHHDNNAEAVMLGVQHLERQQAESEARQSKQILPTTIHLNLNSRYMPPYPPPPFDDLDNTNIFVPTSNNNHIVDNPLSSGIPWNSPMPPTPAIAPNGVNNFNNHHQNLNQSSPTNNFFDDLRDLETEKEKKSFGRMKLTPSRTRTESEFPEAPKDTTLYDEKDENLDSQALISGKLYKLNKSGVWQKRYFETDGQMLTYYKSSKRSKVLATLDLIKVGSICVNLEDPTGCTFQIQVAGRPYFLKAENNGTCQDWVINLNRVREARFQLGGMKLVAPHPKFQPHPQADERNTVNRKPSESSTEMVARVTLDGNRVRTKKITDIDDIPNNTEFAIWQKRQSTLQMVRSRLARFRRWMQLMRCAGTQQESVVLHPVPDPTMYQPHFYTYPNVYHGGFEDRTAEESESQTLPSAQDSSSIGASSSFDRQRPQILQQRSRSGGETSTVASWRRKDADPDGNSMVSEPSPKFIGHDNVPFKDHLHDEDRRCLS